MELRRKCEECHHKKNGGCEVWECNFEPIKPFNKRQFDALKGLANGSNSEYLSVAYDLGQLKAMTTISEAIDDGTISNTADIAELKQKLIRMMQGDYDKEIIGWLDLERS